ncbi:Smr/MutS family protein [bacterium]|nr:Smr/MutS family protein [bacterium]
MNDRDFIHFMLDEGVKPISKKSSGTKSTSKKNGQKSFTIQNTTKSISKKDFEELLKNHDSILFGEEKIVQEKKENQAVIFMEYPAIIDDVDHQIDLHGLLMDEAINKVKEMLIYTLSDKYKTVLIITGKGKHSKHGPILKHAIKTYLLSRGDVIQKVEYAPKSMGGEGAFLVTMR